MSTPSQPNRRPPAFTLIELLVTMVLMVVLYLTVYGSFSRAYQERQKTVCAKNLQMIHLALGIYAAENHDRYPATRNLATAEDPLSLLVPKYTAATEIFVCPGTKDKPPPQAPYFGNRPISYAYYLGRRPGPADQILLTDRQVDNGPKVSSQLLFSPDGKPPGNNHHKYGGNLLFGDGHVDASPPYTRTDLPCPPGVTLLNPRP